jgi:hypothetical protein
MAPDYTHWHGMFEVGERFYMGLIPQARELIEQARGRAGHSEETLDAVLRRPEHSWFSEGAAEQSELVRRQMEERYGQGGRN